MPSHFRFDPLRPFRARHVPPAPPVDDSDDSSPERASPRVIHFPPKSGQRLLPIPDGGHVPRGAPENVSEGTHIALALAKPPDAAHPERPSKKPSMSGVASAPVDVLQPSAKPTLMRRVTSKLHISIPLKSGSQGLRSRPSTRTLPSERKPAKQNPLFRGATVAASPTLPNGFVSQEHREAALRERGLLPPRKDWSEQERDADACLGSVPLPSSRARGGTTEAEQLKAGWLATNRTSESSDSDCGPPVPPSLQTIPPLPPSSPPSDVGAVRRSDEGKADLPPAGRPSIWISLPPLSTSHLEVLPEEPSEQGPITPPPLLLSRPPNIVSSPLEDTSPPIFAESPVSCTFSSHCPGSTLESQSQSDHSLRERDTSRAPVSRRRTSDSADRSRKPAGYSLSRMGTHSLTNLRRTLTESLRRPSTSTLSSADHASQAPRTAISPTMHSIGSILKETRDIEDAESRRLSELAFLD